MYIDILRVHNHWREKTGRLDPLRGVMEVRENNTWRGERERGRGRGREGGREGGRERERERKREGERERRRREEQRF